MTDPREANDTRLEEELRAAWSAPSAREGFADRVLAARAAETLSAPAEAPARRWRARLAPMSLGAAAALLAVVVLGGIDHWLILPSSGSSHADTRTELAIGARARAVAEAGAALLWSVQMGGQATVQQQRGDVFYRVDTGAPFRVETPAGSVVVEGTCFRVQLVAERGLVVSVYEGGVLLSNEGGEVRVGPGEVASTGVKGAPRKQRVLRVDTGAAAPGELDATLAERDALRGRVESLEKQLSSLKEGGRIAPEVLDGETVALRQEVEALREKLHAMKKADLDPIRQAIPFPDGLDARYREEALMSAFQEALRLGEIPGDVRAIDCSEYPCIVHGVLSVGDTEEALREALGRFEARLAEQYPEDESDTQMMVSRMKRRNEAGEEETSDNFAVTITPADGEREPEDAAREAARIRERVGQYFQSSLGK
ncbi:MAG: FecR domain-containing protein [Deltaproteobacteria bacterium]|nr:FecR domain-containing protein [Deltaproteobacteria bacterium]